MRHVSADCSRDPRGGEERSTRMITRRDFFAVVGGGIVVWMVDDADAQESGGGGRRGMSQALPNQVSAWLHINEDGAITVYTGKVEVGQNSRTSLTQAVAEELHTSPESIHMVMGDTALTPYDGGTYGSQTTPRMAPQIHKVAAAAREMLLDLAADKWHVDRSQLVCENGHVRNSSNGQSVSFGELTKG